MKYIILSIFTIIISTTSLLANPYDYKVIRVIDGDTVEIEAPFLPIELKQVLKVRILGVDTPEKGKFARCDQENMMSLQAKLFTEQEISNAKKVQVKIKSWDKYGGRILGDLILDGDPLSKRLIANGYAIEYNGEKKTKDWCAN